MPRTAGRDKGEDLRSTFRGFTFPVMIAALLWYVFYVVIATFAPDAMAQDFLGLNVGLWLGLAQFFTTFLITWVYVKWAKKYRTARSSYPRRDGGLNHAYVPARRRNR